MQEYKLMYRWGAWVTKCRLYAESDKEAIFDARGEYEGAGLSRWPYEVALWCGGRLVHTFKQAEPGRYIAD